MSERNNKRRSHRYWSDLAAQGWGKWEEIPPSEWHKALVPPIPGLKKFIKNNVFSVQVTEVGCKEWGIITRLIIRRHDQGKNVSWKDKQKIKNEIMGKESTALEVFPPESKLFDYANLYHLWIIPENISIPIVLGSSRQVCVKVENQL